MDKEAEVLYMRTTFRLEPSHILYEHGALFVAGEVHGNLVSATPRNLLIHKYGFKRFFEEPFQEIQIKDMTVASTTSKYVYTLISGGIEVQSLPSQTEEVEKALLLAIEDEGKAVEQLKAIHDRRLSSEIQDQVIRTILSGLGDKVKREREGGYTVNGRYLLKENCNAYLNGRRLCLVPKTRVIPYALKVGRHTITLDENTMVFLAKLVYLLKK